MKAIPTLEIAPLHAIGPVRLGCPRADAREALSAFGFPLESSHGTSDYFCDASIQVACGPDERVWFIGVSDSERFTVQFQCKDVFALSAPNFFSLAAAADQSGPHIFTPTEYLFPNQLITLWDADEQYDRRTDEARQVWAQVGIGNSSYAAAITAIRGKV